MNDYMMLDRLRSDVEYSLNTGNLRHLYYPNDPIRHLREMSIIYSRLDEKPEWLTETNIKYYAMKLIGLPYYVAAKLEINYKFDPYNAILDYCIDRVEKLAQQK